MSLREYSWRKLHSGDITYCLFPPFHFFFALPIRVKEKETLFGMEILKNYCGLEYFLYPSTWHQEKKYPNILCKYLKKDDNTVHGTDIPQRRGRSESGFCLFHWFA